MRDLVNYLSPPTLLSFLALSHITSSQLAHTVPMVPTCRHSCPRTPKRTGSFYFQAGLLRNPTHPLLDSFLNLLHPRTCLVEPARD